MDVQTVQAIAEQFLARYKGIKLTLVVRATQEDIYGDAGAEERIGKINGAYHASRGLLTLAASSFRVPSEVGIAIRHELLGHYGLNTLTPVAKRSFLDSICATRGTPALTKQWALVDALYPGRSELRKAEELFAYVAERASGSSFQAATAVLFGLLKKAMVAVGLVDDSLSAGDLARSAEILAWRMRTGHAQQQTFPATDQDQFRRVSAPKNKVGW